MLLRPAGLKGGAFGNGLLWRIDERVMHFAAHAFQIRSHARPLAIKGFRYEAMY